MTGHSDAATLEAGISEVGTSAASTGQPSRTWRAAAVLADVVQLAGAGFLLDFLLFGGTEIYLLLRLAALGLLLVTISRSLGWPVLLAVQLSLLIREPSQRNMLQGLGSLVTSLGAIGLVAYACSFKTTRREFRNLFAATLHTAIHGHRTTLPARLRAPQHPTLAVRAATLVALVLASMLVFVELPVAAPMREQWWQRSIHNGFTLWPGPVVVIVAIALLVLLGYSHWRQMNFAQARLYLRSTFVLYHYRDLKMIVMRRLRAARKAAAKSS
jgi:hypothetical protein